MLGANRFDQSYTKHLFRVGGALIHSPQLADTPPVDAINREVRPL